MSAPLFHKNSPKFNVNVEIQQKKKLQYNLREQQEIIHIDTPKK